MSTSTYLILRLDIVGMVHQNFKCIFKLNEVNIKTRKNTVQLTLILYYYPG